MKKGFVCLLIVLLIFMTSSCVLFDQLVDKGLAWSKQQQSRFISAAANRDRGTLKGLLTDSAQKQADLNAQIDSLFSIFPQSGYEVREIYFFPDSYGYCSSQFAVKSADDILLISMNFDYSDFESESTGIHDIIVVNGNFALNDKRSYNDPTAPGLDVYYDPVSVGKIELLNSYFCFYTGIQRTILLSDVKQFLKQNKNCTMTQFKNEYGEPDAHGIYDYYEVTDGSGVRKWLEVGILDDNDRICWIGLVNDVECLEKLLSID